MNQPKISDMLRRRAELEAKLDKLQREQDQIDVILFAKLAEISGAVDGSAVVRKVDGHMHQPLTRLVRRTRL